VLQCVAVCCSVLQCVAVCCSVLQCYAGVYLVEAIIRLHELRLVTEQVLKRALVLREAEEVVFFTPQFGRFAVDFAYMLNAVDCVHFVVA